MRSISKKWTVFFLALAICLSLGLTACGGGGETTATYTVTFNVNGGTGTVAEQTVNAGGTATDPGSSGLTAPEGTEFAWWSTSADGEAYDFSTAVNANLTLYAVWNPISLTVTFDDGSGTESQTVSYGSVVSAPADPEREGMVFLYWADAEGEEWNFNTAITENLTLTAVWGYEVTFMNGSEVFLTSEVEAGSPVSAPRDPYQDGYRFTGWYTDPECSTAYDFQTPVNAALTLYAGFDAINYVTFWYNLPEDAPAPADDPDTVLDESTQYDGYYYRQEATSGLTLTAPAAPSVLDNGYTFLGWFQDEDCTVPAVFGGTASGEENVNFYGKWEAPATSYEYFVFERAGSTYEISFNYTVYAPRDPVTDQITYWAVPESITIPGTYRGLPVSVAAGGFAGLTLLGVNEAQTHYEYATWNETGCGSLKEIILSEGIISIGAKAFYNDLALTHVVLPSTLTTIGEYAFARDVDYAIHVDAAEHLGVDGGELVIPARVSSLGAYAFRYTQFTSVEFETGSRVTAIPAQCFSVCLNLKSIVLPEGLTSIAELGLNGCYELETVSFPASLRTLGGGVLQNAKKLTSIVGLENTRVTAIPASFLTGAESLSSISLPANVTSFGASCFADTGLTSFTFPAGITAIPGSMFAGADKLLTVDFNNAPIETVGIRAFSGCTSLQSLALPGNVVTIESFAFENCSAMTEFSIPLRCESLGTGAFRGCSSLTTFTVPAGSTDYRAIDGSLYSYDGTILYCPAPGQGGTFTIAEGTTTVWEYAFYNMSSVTGVVFPSTLTSIGYGAFGGTDAQSVPQIAEYVFPASLTTIDSHAFAYTSATFSFEPGSQIDAIPTMAFAYYANSSLSIPDNIVTLDTGAFAMGTMETIDLNNVKYILNSAFTQCYNLTELTIPDGLEVIGNWAFTGNVTGVPEEYQNAPKFTSLSLPASVVAVGDMAFADNIALESLTIAPDSRLMYLGTYSFINTALTSLDLSMCDNLRVIGSYAFSQDALTALTFPTVMNFTEDESVYADGFATSVDVGDGGTPVYEVIDLNNMYGLDIRDHAFSLCYGLTEVVLPEGVTSLGTGAFAGASAADDEEGNPTVARNMHLESITLPSTLVSIGENVLAYNDAMTELVIPNGSYTDPSTGETSYLDYIPMYAFNRMYALESVVIEGADKPAAEGGSHITVIDDYAFRDNADMTSFTLPYELEEVGLDAFTGTGVAAFTIGDPAENTGAHFQVIEGDLYDLAGTTLVLAAAKTGLEVYEIRQGVTDIAEGALSSLRADKVIFPNTVKTVGRFALRDNPNVKAIEFADNNPNTISLGQRLAMNASSLASVDFGNNKYTLGTFLFQATAMTEFVLPEGETDVPDGMYYACGQLGGIDLTGITSVGSWAFAGYTLDSTSDNKPDLGDLVIPNTVTSLGQEAFRGSNVTTVVFEEGSTVTGLATSTFRGCDELTSVTLPASLRSIGTNTFDGCRKLTTLVLNSSNPPTLGEGALNNCEALEHIYVPAGREAGYRNAAGWSAYADIISAAPAAQAQAEAAEAQAPAALQQPEALAAEFRRKAA